MLAPEFTGPLGAMRAVRASVDESLLRFQCHRCTRVRRTREIALWGGLFALMGLVLLLVKLGILQ